MTSIVLEYDDIHPLHPENCLKEIDEFVRLFPNIKLSFFCPPLLRGVPLYKDKDWCGSIRKHIESGNVCLARHGLTHEQEEFKNLDLNEAEFRLKVGDAAHDVARLPYVKVFRGPHWGINMESITALINQGYTHLYNHQDYKELGDKYKNEINVRYYNWNLNSDAPKEDLLITHGHTHDVCDNGISQTFAKVASFVDKVKPGFKFVNEV